MNITLLKNTLTANIQGEARDIVESWIDDAHENNDERWMKNIYYQIDQYSRIKSHYDYAVWWAIKKITQGRTFEDVVQSWSGGGNYFVSIGIGPGFFHQEKVHRETIGVKIYGLGTKTYKGRDIFAEAKRVIIQRNKKQLIFNL